MANKYAKGFYTLMSEAGILSSKSFGLYINDVVGFNNIQKLDLDGFTWDEYSSLTFDFKDLVMSNRVKVMATYTDKDSEAIPFGTEGFTETSGVVPTMKARFIWDSDDYRKYLDAVRNLDFQNKTAKQYALDLLFNGIKDIQSAHELSMTYQRDQIVSGRELSLDANNNPRGIKGLVFKSAVPGANVTTVAKAKRWFNNATDKNATTANANADPVGNMKAVVRSMKRKGYMDIVVEADYISFLEDMDHPKWRTAMGYQMRPDLVLAASNDANALAVGNAAGDDELVALFAKIIGVPAANVHLRKGLAGVEVLEGKGPDAKLVRKTQRTFKANTYVFYPAGPIGTIKSTLALTPDDSFIYAKFFGDRGLIQYEFDAKARTQDWWSELNALCVPSRPQEMYYLITYTD